MQTETPTKMPDEFLNRCPACKQVSHFDDWEVCGADPGYQFCPVCSREVEPINLYLESKGCYADSPCKINHDGPTKARDEMESELAKLYEARGNRPQRERNEAGDAYGMTFIERQEELPGFGASE